MLADADSQSLISYVRRNEIGAGIPISSPFGAPRPLLYVDHTASGRALSFIEEVVQKLVLPHYGNTVSAESRTSGPGSLMLVSDPSGSASGA